MRYGYFDSEIVGTDPEGMPIFDRAETSDLFRLLFAKLVSNGVLASPGDCFQVIAAEGLNVTVRPGFGMINGAFAYDESENKLALDKAPAQYSRIDRIVLRCNYADRLCELVVKTGTVAANPAPPAIVQPSAGDYYELGLATVLVGSNATVVTQANITDTRMDRSVCGLITQLIDHLDTDVFFAQLDQFYKEFVNKANNDFDTWFQSIKDKLSGDIAGSLQNQIDNLSEQVKTTPVKAPLPAAGWVGDSAPFNQTVTVDGLADERRAMVYPRYGDDTKANLAMREACACVSYAKRDGSNITFTCLEDKPGVDITVTVEVYV